MVRVDATVVEVMVRVETGSHHGVLFGLVIAV